MKSIIDKGKEARLRYRLKKLGYRLHKSRWQSFNNGYSIAEINTNIVVAGSNYQLNLNDVEDYYKDVEDFLKNS